MDKKVVSLNKEKKYPVMSEVVKRLNAVIDDYIGEISTIEAIGALELVKVGFIDRAKESLD